MTYFEIEKQNSTSYFLTSVGVHILAVIGIWSLAQLEPLKPQAQTIEVEFLSPSLEVDKIAQNIKLKKTNQARKKQKFKKQKSQSLSRAQKKSSRTLKSKKLLSKARPQKKAPTFKEELRELQDVMRKSRVQEVNPEDIKIGSAFSLSQGEKELKKMNKNQEISEDLEKEFEIKDGTLETDIQKLSQETKRKQRSLEEQQALENLQNPSKSIKEDLSSLENDFFASSKGKEQKLLQAQKRLSKSQVSQGDLESLEKEFSSSSSGEDLDLVQKELSGKKGGKSLEDAKKELNSLENSRTYGDDSTGGGSAGDSLISQAPQSLKGHRNFRNLEQLTGNIPPRYPQTARRQKLEGALALTYFVNKQGLVEKIRVYQSSGFEVLDEEALRSIQNFRYKPGDKGWVIHDVEFRLINEKEVL